MEATVPMRQTKQRWLFLTTAYQCHPYLGIRIQL
jgi:hypothetical protein